MEERTLRKMFCRGVVGGGVNSKLQEHVMTLGLMRNGVDG